MIECRDDLHAADGQGGHDDQQRLLPLASPDRVRDHQESGLNNHCLIADDQDDAEEEGGKGDVATASSEGKPRKPGDAEKHVDQVRQGQKHAAESEGDGAEERRRRAQL